VRFEEFPREVLLRILRALSRQLLLTQLSPVASVRFLRIFFQWGPCGVSVLWFSKLVEEREICVEISFLGLRSVLSHLWFLKVFLQSMDSVDWILWTFLRCRCLCCVVGGPSVFFGVPCGTFEPFGLGLSRRPYWI
jgi:hypothetical protein